MTIPAGKAWYWMEQHGGFHRQRIGYWIYQRRVPDITRIRTAINWEPQYSLNDILNNIIDFHRVQ